MIATDRPGASNWVDIAVPDVDAAVAFYRAVLGWDHQPGGPQAGKYGFFHLGGRTVAAVGPLMGEGARPAWTLYFHSADADATTKAVEQAGGTVRFGPHDVFDAGRMCGFTDPTGADFAVWQPGKVGGLDATSEPGSLCWATLYTTGDDVAKSFYGAALGWDIQDVPVDGMTYTIVSPSGGGMERAHGGITRPAPEQGDTPSHWQPYFETADCDAAVAAALANGGRVLAGPTDLDQVGRVARVADPAGARFTLITSAPEATT